MSKLHLNEALIGLDLVKKLIKNQFPHWSHLFVESINSTGTDNAIYRLGDSMAIRLPRIHNAAANIHKEYTWLPQLSPHISLSIPKPLAKGKPDEGYPYPWLIYQWINGENALRKSINLEQAAISLGNFVLDLQKINSYHAPRSNRGTVLTMLDKKTCAAITSLRNIVNAAKAIDCWKKIISNPVWTGTPVWVHSDLHPGNILALQKNVIAVIDFGMAGIGDPACDFMVAWTLLSAKHVTYLNLL